MTTRREHNEYQANLFLNEIGDSLREIPANVQSRLTRIVEAAQLKPSDRVLDVGTGTGVLIPYITSWGVKKILGCDLSSVMLAEAQRRFPQIEFWEGDVIDLPLTKGPFHACYFNSMFGNVWDPRETLTHIVKLTSVGARIVISHPLGASYVAHLRGRDPKRVPRLFPDEHNIYELIDGLPFAVRTLTDKPDLYILVLTRSRR